MQDKKIKRLTTVMAVALAVGTFCGMLLAMLAMMNSDGEGMQDVAFMVRVLVCLFGTYYLAVGYSKEKGAELFKAYLWSYAVSCLLLLLNKTVRSNASAVCVCILQAAALCLLAAGKDLGGRRSKLLAGSVTVLAVVQTVLQIVLADSVSVRSGIGFGVDIILGLSVLVLVIAKYEDKKARGRDIS